GRSLPAGFGASRGFWCPQGVHNEAALAKPDPRDTVAYWRREAERNRHLADAMLAFHVEGLTEYLSVLGCVEHVATHGIYRGSRRGPPPAAQALLRGERKELARRGRVLLAKLDTLVGESPTEPASGLDAGR